MEVEESSDGDEFRSVNGTRKRKKISDGVVGGNGQEEHLLNNNKFSPLVKNNNNNGKQAGKGDVPTVPVVPVAKKPPPLVVKNTSYAKLRSVMSPCTTKPSYKLTPFGIKLLCSSEERFETARAHLIANNVEFYTHEKRSERQFRVVVRGLPPASPEFVKKNLKESQNLDAVEVHAIKRKGESASSEETPYIVTFPKGYTNLKQLSEIKRLRRFHIRWEAYRHKRPNVTQCRNCLQLGHGTRNCHLKGRCNNCGGPHKTDECEVQEAQPKRCANCSGAHEATNRSCPKRADFIQRRQQASKPKPPARKAEKQSSAVPAFTPAEFPPLPGAVPDENSKDRPRPAGSSKGSSGSRDGGATEEEAGEVLYSSAELWGIFSEYIGRFKTCKTRLDQVTLVSYMISKYGM